MDEEQGRVVVIIVLKLCVVHYVIANESCNRREKT